MELIFWDFVFVHNSIKYICFQTTPHWKLCFCLTLSPKHSASVSPVNLLSTAPVEWIWVSNCTLYTFLTTICIFNSIPSLFRCLGPLSEVLWCKSSCSSLDFPFSPASQALRFQLFMFCCADYHWAMGWKSWLGQLPESP